MGRSQASLTSTRKISADACFADTAITGAETGIVHQGNVRTLFFQHLE